MVKNIIFDFDSTLVNVEGIELLVQNALKGQGISGQRERIRRLQEITNRAMNGDLSLLEALRQRLALARIRRDLVRTTAEEIAGLVNPGVKEVLRILLEEKRTIFVFSGSFEELVFPVTDLLGIPRENVYANRLVYNEDGEVVGIDEQSPLVMSSGKVYLAERLKNSGKLTGFTAVVGDGSTDLSIRKVKVAQWFVYYAGSVIRPEVKKQADFVVEKFEQLIPLFCKERPPAPISQQEGETRTPPPRVVLFEKIHPKALERFRSEGFNAEIRSHALLPDDNLDDLLTVQAVGIRSRSRVTAKTLARMPNLCVIGAFCIGTDGIDLRAAANAGIPVFHAPYSNTRSVAELVAGQIIFLMRRIIEKNSALHRGEWRKSADGCREIRGKTVGIVGYGHIGSQVSVLLENLGMKVLFYDIVDKLPLGNARKAPSLKELLQQADVVSLHVPDTPETRGMIGKQEIDWMKPGSYLINTSRGTVVDLLALKDALEAGRLAGAAIDVFPEEPNSPDEAFATPLQGIPNVILTPHIGGSTLEAQENIGMEVSEKLVNFLKSGSTVGAVNFPQADLPRVPNTHRILHVHSNVPGVLAKINAVFAARGINVESQILKTHDNIGYLIMDVSAAISEQVLELLRHMSETIRVRKIV